MEAMGKPRNLLEWVKKNRPRDLRTERMRVTEDIRKKRSLIN